MGRPPCCEKVGMKKGPWTPEEDILLVSYVQEHGPANWRAVPTNTGLKRCSKSCRLRWTNYLRPGIKRGTFTHQEDKMIIQLQALLGNKWAAIASYLPQRTDNDIKNYWNTHLSKKLKKLSNEPFSNTTTSSHSISRGKWERRLQTDINTAKQALQAALSIDENRCNLSEFLTSSTEKPSPSSSSSYASSTENIARLLKGWVKKTPNSEEFKCSSSSSNNSVDGGNLSESFESLFGLEQSFDQSSDDFSRSTSPSIVNDDSKPGPIELGPLSVLEEWLLDDHGNGYLEDLSFDMETQF